MLTRLRPLLRNLQQRRRLVGLPRPARPRRRLPCSRRRRPLRSVRGHPVLLRPAWAPVFRLLASVRRVRWPVRLVVQFPVRRPSTVVFVPQPRSRRLVPVVRVWATPADGSSRPLYGSHDETWSVSKELLESSPDFLDLSEWRLGTREYARLRERLFSVGSRLDAEVPAFRFPALRVSSVDVRRVAVLPGTLVLWACLPCWACLLPRLLGTLGRIPDFPVTRSHPPASWPSAANSSICRTYRKTAGEESRRRSPVANRWMRP